MAIEGRGGAIGGIAGRGGANGGGAAGGAGGITGNIGATGDGVWAGRGGIAPANGLDPAAGVPAAGVGIAGGRGGNAGRGAVELVGVGIEAGCRTGVEMDGRGGGAIGAAGGRPGSTGAEGASGGGEAAAGDGTAGGAAAGAGTTGAGAGIAALAGVLTENPAAGVGAEPKWTDAIACEAGVNSSAFAPFLDTVITPPHTAQRARTPLPGTLAGSTRNTDLHSGQATFIGDHRC